MYDHETMSCGDCRYGSKQSSLVDCYTDLHAEWSSHYVVVMLARVIVHQENILTLYVTVYIQLMVVCIYLRTYYSKVVSTKSYNVL